MPVFTLGLLGFVAIASIYDLRERRIPNGLVLVGAAVGLVIGAVQSGGAGLAEGFLGMLAGGAILFPAFALGWLGAGDVKLAGALAAWLGIASVPRFLASTLVAGGVVSAVVIAVEVFRRRMKPTRDERGSRFSEVPYALAVGAGAIVAFATRGAP